MIGNKPLTNAEVVRRYKAKNTFKVRLDSRAGHMNKRGKNKHVSAKILKQILLDYGTKCYYCDVGLSLDKRWGVTFDHVLPYVFEASNIVPACWECNRIKSNASAEHLERIASKIRQFVAARLPHSS